MIELGEASARREGQIFDDDYIRSLSSLDSKGLCGIDLRGFCGAMSAGDIYSTLSNLELVSVRLDGRSFECLHLDVLHGLFSDSMRSISLLHCSGVGELVYEIANLGEWNCLSELCLVACRSDGGYSSPCESTLGLRSFVVSEMPIETSLFKDVMTCIDPTDLKDIMMYNCGVSGQDALKLVELVLRRGVLLDYLDFDSNDIDRQSFERMDEMIGVNPMLIGVHNNRMTDDEEDGLLGYANGRFFS